MEEKRKEIKTDKRKKKRKSKQNNWNSKVTEKEKKNSIRKNVVTTMFRKKIK